MRSILTFLLAITFNVISAQTVADFENFGITTDAFLNGSDQSGGFSAGNVFLNNDYNAGYSSWSGFSISATTDVTTPGFTNQYSANVGMGVDGSLTYATSYAFNPVVASMTNEAAGEEVRGMYVTNATYAALSMASGDAYTKKFGGATGDDPDYFVLTIKKYLGGTLSTESVDFYLADFRFEDNSMDYIVNEWTWVDLTALGAADSLSFSLSSTDNGNFGMNTPAYFCIDNLTTGDGVSSTRNLLDIQLLAFPNPATDHLNVLLETSEAMEYMVYDFVGNQMMHGAIEIDGQTSINIQRLSPGQYVLFVKSKDGFTRTLFTKM